MASAVFQFGDCSINIASRELLRAGERVNLSPIVFDCIAYLIQHRERAVGRDELVAAVWGKAEISDTMLGKAILAARRATGDSAEAQAILRTVPRFGYRWVAPTEEIAGPEPMLPDVAEIELWIDCGPLHSDRDSIRKRRCKRLGGIFHFHEGKRGDELCDEPRRDRGIQGLRQIRQPDVAPEMQRRLQCQGEDQPTGPECCRVTKADAPAAAGLAPQPDQAGTVKPERDRERHQRPRVFAPPADAVYRWHGSK